MRREWCAECMSEDEELFPIRVRGSGKTRWYNMCAECKERREKEQRWEKKPKTEAELEEERRLDARLAERMKCRAAIPTIKMDLEDRSYPIFSMTPPMDVYQYFTSQGTEGYRMLYAAWRWFE